MAIAFIFSSSSPGRENHTCRQRVALRWLGRPLGLLMKPGIDLPTFAPFLFLFYLGHQRRIGLYLRVSPSRVTAEEPFALYFFLVFFGGDFVDTSCTIPPTELSHSCEFVRGMGQSSLYITSPR